MTAGDIYRIIDDFAPFSRAMAHDNAGFLIGHADAAVTGVLVTLDADRIAMEHALASGCNTVVSHHPFFFEGENRVNDRTPQGRKILFAIENGFNIICAHTNLDACEGGVGDTMGKLLGLHAESGMYPTQNGGMLGRVGTHRFADREAFLAHAARALGVRPRYRFVNDKFEKIAWVSGSGASALESAACAGADTLVTGDVKYGMFMEAAEWGVNLIDLGHFETEQIIVPVVAKLLSEKGVSVTRHMIKSPIIQE